MDLPDIIDRENDNEDNEEEAEEDDKDMEIHGFSCYYEQEKIAHGDTTDENSITFLEEIITLDEEDDQVRGSIQISRAYSIPYPHLQGNFNNLA